MKEVVKEKDTVIDKILNGTQDKEGQVTSLRVLLKEKDLQIEAMFTKMEDMKQSHDQLNLRHLDATRLLEQMNSSDFAKQNLILKKQNEQLSSDLTLKTQYLEDLKQNIKLAL